LTAIFSGIFNKIRYLTMVLHWFRWSDTKRPTDWDFQEWRTMQRHWEFGWPKRKK